MQTVYKVCRVLRIHGKRRFFSWSTSKVTNTEYHLAKETTPAIPGSLIFVFTDLGCARGFARGTAGRSKFTVLQCEIEETEPILVRIDLPYIHTLSKVQEFWDKRLHNKIIPDNMRYSLTACIPPSTVGVRQLKVTRELGMY